MQLSCGCSFLLTLNAILLFLLCWALSAILENFPPDSAFAKKNPRLYKNLQHVSKNLQKYEDFIKIFYCLLLSAGLFSLSWKILELVALATSALTLIQGWDFFVLTPPPDGSPLSTAKKSWPFYSFDVILLQWNDSLTIPGLSMGIIVLNVCLRNGSRVLLQDLAADSVFAKKSPRLYRSLQYACEGLQRYGHFATLIACLFGAYSLLFVPKSMIDVADVARDAIAFATPNEEVSKKNAILFYELLKSSNE